MKSAGAVREPACSGSWYPGAEGALREQLEKYLSEAASAGVLQEVQSWRPLGLVAPHAGYVYSGAVAGYSFAAARGQEFRRVVLLGPSHRVSFRGLSVSVMSAYRTPLGDLPVDCEAVGQLAGQPLFSQQPEAEKLEHSLELELPFLQVVAPQAQLVPIVVGDLRAKDAKQAAEAIRPLVNEKTLVVASSDFTHYGSSFGYVPFRSDRKKNLRKLDYEAIAFLMRGEAEGFIEHCDRTGVTICGHRPIGVLVNLMPEGAEKRVLEYSTSGDLTGDWSHCVSYASIGFFSTPLTLSAGEQETLLALARAVLQERLEEGGAIPGVEERFEITPRLRQPASLFVTLRRRRDGDLRGCLGCLSARDPLFEAVQDYALKSAREDTRFSAVTPDEAKELTIEVSVLTEPHRLDDVEQLVVGHHGVCLKKGGQTGVFLPQVATEQGWDRAELLAQLGRKAGLSREAWQEKGAQLEVFTAQKCKEREPH